VTAASPLITLRVNDLRLETALESVLKLANLDYDIRDQAIEIKAKVKTAKPPRKPSCIMVLKSPCGAAGYQPARWRSRSRLRAKTRTMLGSDSRLKNAGF